MSASLIEHTPSAYDYPLLIEHLLHTPLATTPDQEIVYRDLTRYSYRTLRQRIGRLATGLATLGVKPGDTIAACGHSVSRSSHQFRSPTTLLVRVCSIVAPFRSCDQRVCAKRVNP